MQKGSGLIAAEKQQPKQLELKLKVKLTFSGIGKTTGNILKEHPYDFYFAGWMGGDNPHCCWKELEHEDHGVSWAELVIAMMEGDFDMLKHALWVRDPDAGQIRHVVGSYVSLQDILEDLLKVKKGEKPEVQYRVVKDNYTPNSITIQIFNNGTDLDELSEFMKTLTKSVLHMNDQINTMVADMTMGIHNLIQSHACVEAVNGGNTFLNSACFLQASGCAINYPLLGATYSSPRHGWPLAMLAYKAAAMRNYTNLTSEMIDKMESKEFLKKAMIPLLTANSKCKGITKYASDMNIAQNGTLSESTEDYAMPGCAHMYMDVKGPCKKSFLAACHVGSDLEADLSAHQKQGGDAAGVTTSLSLPPVVEANLTLIKEHVKKSLELPVDHPSNAIPVQVDDCESLMGGILSEQTAIIQGFERAKALALESEDEVEGKEGKTKKKKDKSLQSQAVGLGLKFTSPRLNARQLSKVAAVFGDIIETECKDMQNMKHITHDDYQSMGRQFTHFAVLHENSLNGQKPSGQGAAAVVSASGASFTTGVSQLNGHACAQFQAVSEDGKADYWIMEPTSNIKQQNIPVDCPKRVGIKLTDGIKEFQLGEALEIFNSNTTQLTSCGGSTGFEKVLGETFHDDPYKSCPFYKSSFFLGIRTNEFTPCIIPVDYQLRGKDGLAINSAQIGEEVGSAGTGKLAQISKPMLAERPCFGAPTAQMGSDRVKAIEIDVSKALGKKLAAGFLNAIDIRNFELPPPRASDKTFHHVMSRWADLDPLPGIKLSSSSDPQTSEASDKVEIYSPELKKDDKGRYIWHSNSAESYMNAEILESVIAYKKILAAQFNSLQAADPANDGVTMHVTPFALSACTRFDIPLPTGNMWDLSTVRNLRKAIEIIGPLSDKKLPHDLRDLKKEEKTQQKQQHVGAAMVGVGDGGSDGGHLRAGLM